MKTPLPRKTLRLFTSQELNESKKDTNKEEK